jgi:hypothetical protein
MLLLVLSQFTNLLIQHFYGVLGKASESAEVNVLIRVLPLSHMGNLPDYVSQDSTDRMSSFMWVYSSSQ